MSRKHKNNPHKPTIPPKIFVHILSPRDYLDFLSLRPLNTKAKYGQCFLTCTDGISRPFEGHYLGTNTFLISASEYAGAPCPKLEQKGRICQVMKLEYIPAEKSKSGKPTVRFVPDESPNAFRYMVAETQMKMGLPYDRDFFLKEKNRRMGTRPPIELPKPEYPPANSVIKINTEPNPLTKIRPKDPYPIPNPALRPMTLDEAEASRARLSASLDRYIMSRQGPAQGISERGKIVELWDSETNLSQVLPAVKRIYIYGTKCHCSSCAKQYGRDTIIDCTAQVETIYDRRVRVTVQYCTGCQNFFINYEALRGYDEKYGKIRFLSLLDWDMFQSEMITNGFADSSFLSQNGYFVGQKSTLHQRRIALMRILDNHIAAKWQIIEKLTSFINIRYTRPEMQLAISHWREDIAFVSDYKAGSHVDVGPMELEQKGKIREK